MSATDRLSSTGKLSREARVLHRRDFLHAQRRGVRVHTPAFTVVAVVNSARHHPRIGCAVSRKIGKAVVRNRIRRLIKETFRRLSSQLSDADYVVIARPRAAGVAAQGFAVLAEELIPALESAGVRATQRRSRRR